jgi:hypothetical protein
LPPKLGVFHGRVAERRVPARNRIILAHVHIDVCVEAIKMCLNEMKVGWCCLHSRFF